MFDLGNLIIDHSQKSTTYFCFYFSFSFSLFLFCFSFFRFSLSSCVLQNIGWRKHGRKKEREKEEEKNSKNASQGWWGLDRANFRHFLVDALCKSVSFHGESLSRGLLVWFLCLFFFLVLFLCFLSLRVCYVSARFFFMPCCALNKWEWCCVAFVLPCAELRSPGETNSQPTSNNARHCPFAFEWLLGVSIEYGVKHVRQDDSHKRRAVEEENEKERRKPQLNDYRVRRSKRRCGGGGGGQQRGLDGGERERC